MQSINKTSIIVTAYDETALHRRITSACLGNINRFTNRDEYELILVDQNATNNKTRWMDLNTRHHFIDIDKHIKLDNGIGQSAAFNLGYKNSNPDYGNIIFIHNDVLVNEGWLSILRSCIEGKENAIIMPHQGPSNREHILQMYSEKEPRGNDDAGLIMMSKETFKKTGGWDERFSIVCQAAAFYTRFPNSYSCTGKCLITHITAINMYDDEDMAREFPLFDELKLTGKGKDINYL
mgnify:CR=1 FL=1